MSVMIVDGSLATSMAWIAEYIDNINEDSERTLTQLVGELATPEEVSQEVYFSLAEASHSLLKAPDNEFEGAFNLLLYILSQSGDFSGCIPVVLANLNVETSETKQLLILAVLGNFFNVMQPENKLRFDVLSKIVDFSTNNGTLGQLATQLKQLPEWLEQWKTDAETAVDFYTKIINLVEEHVGPRPSFELLLDAVKYTSNETLTKRLIATSLANTFTYNFDELLAVPAVAKLDDGVLKAVAAGDYEAVKGNTNEDVLNKVRVVKFVELAATAKSQSYDSIRASTGLTSDLEVEALAIDAIKAGLVQGRMDQFKREFYVESVSIVGEVTKEHWKQIDERLQQVQEALQKHRSVLEKRDPVERLGA